MTDSTAKRVIRGSIVSWVRIAITMLLQLLVTPLFLSFWGAAHFGDWLVLIAAVGMIQMIAASHQYYIGFEIMRIGAKYPRFYSRVVNTGFRGAAVITFLQMAILLGLAAITYRTTSVAWPVFSEMGWAVLVMGTAQFPLTNWVGIWERVAVQRGGYERSCWWGIASAVGAGISPILVIPGGGGILAAAVACGVATAAIAIWTGIDLRRFGRPFVESRFPAHGRLLLFNLSNSQWLTAKTLMEGFRQQGVRLIISPLAGAAGLAAFSTMRTGANVALQGLGTITAPIMPELMRFLNQRDQQRSEAAFGSVWMTLVAGMCPAVLVLQVVIEPFFQIWTRGKIPFDPFLFASLSLGVLVYAFSQPAVALVQGHNLLRVQVWITGIAAAVTLAGVVWLVPHLHLFGAGLGLLAAELVAAAGYVWIAAGWMKDRGMRWPTAAARSVGMSVVVAGAAMALIAARPREAIWTAAVGLGVLTVAAVLYWRQLPTLARHRALEMFASRLPSRLKRHFQRV